MLRSSSVLLAAAVASLPLAAFAQVAATPQRPSFTTDASTTAPGTVEIEFGGAAFDSLFSLPTTVKFTPDVDAGLLRELEWSVGFDGLINETGRNLRFSDSVVLGVRKAVYEGGGFALAVAPAVTLLTRDADGVRVGATTIGVYQFGANALIGNLTWSGATDPSEGNPSRKIDWMGGAAHSFGRASLFVEALYEDPAGLGNTLSLMQGVSFAARPNVVLDFALLQSGVNGATDIGALFGLTVNLGRW